MGSKADIENEQEPSATKSEDSVPNRNNLPVQNVVSSDSKTPLKMPVNEGDEDVQVKFVSGNSMTINEVNGAAKIDMDTVKLHFSGMSKEELLKYANDPFWIRTRLIFFVLFWVVWIAMFVGAIFIIFVAPKCDFESSSQLRHIYDIDVESFLGEVPSKNSMLLKKFIPKMSYLKDIKAGSVILPQIFKTYKGNDEEVVDFKNVDEKYGSLDDFKNLMKEAKANDIRIILSFVPNHSSDKHNWFNRSVAKEEPYDKYYVWAPNVGTEIDGSKIPPNNWHSFNGGSAWEWNDERQEFYLHQFGVHQPDLNFHNPLVLQELNNTLNFWLDLGVAGFNLEKAQYLLEDESLQNEEISRKPGVVHTDYDFYYHSKTHNLPETSTILSQWRQIIYDKTEGKGFLIITGDPPIPADSNGTVVLVDLIRNDKLLMDLPRNFSAKDLYPRIENFIQHSDKSLAFQLGSKENRLADRFSEADIDGLHIITLLLKGTPITYFGDELGIRNKTYFPWTNESHSLWYQEKAEKSHFKIFKALMEARESKAVINGTTDFRMLNDSLIVLTRLDPDGPSYLAVYNLSPENVTADFSTINNVPEKITVYTMSLNYKIKGVKLKDEVDSDDVAMSPRSAIVFTFTPKGDKSI